MKRTFIYIGLVITFTLSSSLQVYAVGLFDKQFYSGNDIPGFYDPRAGSCVLTTTSTTLTGDSGEEKAFNYFVTKGLTEKQSAGLVGNLKAESGVISARLQGAGMKLAPDDYIPKDREGFGIAQWTFGGRGAAGTPPYKDRQGGLINLAKSKNVKVTDLALQLDYVWKEISPGGARGSVLRLLKATTSIKDASDVILKRFESPLVLNYSARRAISNEVYGKYAKNTTDQANTDNDDEANDRSDINTQDGTAAATEIPANTGNANCGTQAGDGDIVSIAQAELKKNVKEQPIGCDAGNPSRKGDCGPEVNKYTDSTLEYWCADFVSWVYKEAGKPFTGGSSGGWRIASVSGVRAWFQKNGTYTKNGPGVKPKPGDVYMTASESHIGIVEKVEGNTIYTISGNTSVTNYSNGVGVGSSKVPVGNSSISGFGSLKNGTSI